jgi:hypothetical protein
VRFRKEYFFLSNFFPVPIYYGGYTWPTSEHIYQAYKTEDRSLREFFLRLPRPEEAKYHGKSVELRPGWIHLRVPLMLSILQAKFFQNPEIAGELVATGKIPIVEDNTWHDNFWGNCSCGKKRECEVAGQNMLGRALMEVREQLIFSMVTTGH